MNELMVTLLIVWGAAGAITIGILMNGSEEPTTKCGWVVLGFLCGPGVWIVALAILVFCGIGYLWTHCILNPLIRLIEWVDKFDV